MSTYVNITPSTPTFTTLAGGGFAAFTALVSGGFATEVIPELAFEQESAIYETWKPENSGMAQTQYKISDKSIDSIQKIETIHKFASNLLENIEDLDPEFSNTIDENYWDLI